MEKMNIKRLLSLAVLIVFLITMVPIEGFAKKDKRNEGEEIINLALGKNYQVNTLYPPDEYYTKVHEVNYPDNGNKLTDGQYGSLDFTDKAYVGYLFQGFRDITIDLEAPATVEEIALSVLQDVPVGIYFPQEVEFYLSMDGQKWEFLGRAYSEVPTSEKGPIKQKISKMDINKIARYVKIIVPVEGWLFVDEVEVWGTNSLSGNKLKANIKEILPFSDKKLKGYPKPKDVGGIENEVLIYTGDWEYDKPGENWISFTKEDFKPYVAYLDKDLKPKDIMFDTFLFVPYSKLPDGATFNPTGGKPTNKTHFEYFLNRLFRAEYELGALNEAVKEFKKELNSPKYKEYRAKVVITIPFPRTDQSDFGDIDGSGISLNLNVSEVGEEEALINREKVVKWFIDEVYKRWETAGYDELELAGFYWDVEYVPYHLSSLEGKLIKSTAEYIHSKGGTFQWIPYYFARGWYKWNQLGFDGALMQPNYMWVETGKDRLDTILKATYDYGLGIEMEMSDAVLTDSKMREKYYTYIDKAFEYKYAGKAYTAFYQQVKTLLKAAKSSDPGAREVYDRTYNFIKGIKPEKELRLLSLGKHYTVKTPYPPDKRITERDEPNYPDDGVKLTDGKYASTDFKDKGFAGFLFQGFRIITVDLEEEATVERIGLSVLQDTPLGIMFPQEVWFFLSNDGTNWEKVGRSTSKVSTSDKGPVKQIISLDKINKKARYVAVTVPTEGWLFIDEIEVWGRIDKSGKPLKPDTQWLLPSKDKGFPTFEMAGNVKASVLIHTGEWEYDKPGEEWITFTKEDFKPYVTYVDKNLQPVDWMFDGYLFVPYQKVPPFDEGVNFGPKGKPANKTHYEYYLNRLFREGHELYALEEAVKEAKEALNDPNYKVKAIIAVPNPRSDQSNFGVIDESGQSLNLNISEVGEEKSLENRVKVIKWFIDEVLKKWEVAKFENIELAGFYLESEKVYWEVNSLEHELFQQMAEYLHSKGLKFYWIPYYSARGWYRWQELGYDVALMQPNYMFDAFTDEKRIDATLQMAYDFGLGLEMEMSDAALNNEVMRNKYYAYINKAFEYGYAGKAPTAFYQQVKTLLQAAKSSNPATREVYDRTYNFLKGRQ